MPKIICKYKSLVKIDSYVRDYLHALKENFNDGSPAFMGRQINKSLLIFVKKKSWLIFGAIFSHFCQKFVFNSNIDHNRLYFLSLTKRKHRGLSIVHMNEKSKYE